MQKNWLASAIASLALAASAGVSAQTTVLTFDDITPRFISSYGGLTWGGPNEWFVGSQSSPYLSHSSPNVVVDGAFSVPGEHHMVSFATPAIFDGVYIAGNTGLGDFSLRLVLAGATVATVAGSPITGQVIFLSSGYSGLIDSIEINAAHTGLVVFDDFTFHAASVTAVPEPSTYAMLAAGLGMIGFIGNRRRRARP